MTHPLVGTFQEASAAAGEPFALWGIGAQTDMGFATELGMTPSVNYGPGDPSQAHQPNEHVALGELVACAKVIALTAARWCR